MPSVRRVRKSPAIRIPGYLLSDLGILLVTAVTLFTVYTLDTMTPLGQPVWLLYFIPLILAYFSVNYYAIPSVFIITMLFLVAGFLASPQGISVQYAILNRFTFFLFFFLIALFLWLVRRRQIRGEKL